ncbi:mechanosensitive ion channel domain-containing protein [Pseudooctadecabacter jejudonensis]|uniref:Small-conductance mechanosensitive channel n=1 Tax=Pseudooctadecabacter jejudonensis TaxID=1391910 RepID=A0A1Y5SUB8_9RHOB|nr:mechanosensitive ion channel domain-containing protein [Pseudooctadecabacter jejudonensis]SLN47102.1 Small-conductance mechanosensitive channel [Pseudooctadecabacter jejudonensis]
MRLFSLLLSAFMICATFTAAQEAPSGPIATEQSVQQDADIANRIRDILRELGNYSDVTVTVSDGVVTLRGTTNSLIEAQDLDTLVNRIEGVVAVKNDVTETTDLARRLDPAMERFMGRIEALLVQLPLALIALTVFLLINWLGAWVGRWRNPWDRLAPNAFIADLFRTVARIAFLIAAIVIALDIMNATALLSTILGAAGLIGLAIGFAVRDTVENFIASVMLSIRQPFRPNDVVEINGDQGKVIRLTSRATILLSFDGNHIRIPNATVFKSRIINFSQNRERRFTFTIGIDSAADLGSTRELVIKTVKDLPFVLDEPAADAWIGDITDAGIEIIVVGWINQNETSMVRARGETLRLVKYAIEASGVSLPNTTYTIEMGGGTLTADPGPQTDATNTPPNETTEIAEVSAQSDEDLDKLIDAERQTEEAEDLLREDAAKE